MSLLAESLFSVNKFLMNKIKLIALAEIFRATLLVFYQSVQQLEG